MAAPFAGNRTSVDDRLRGDVGDFDLLRLSPDGRRIAAEIQQTDEEDFQIWIYDLDQQTFVRLSLEGRFNYGPAWLDASTVAYVSGDLVDGEEVIVAQPTDGGPNRVLFRSTRDVWNFTASPIDGTLAVTVEGSTSETSDIVRVLADGTSTPFANSRFGELAPTISPDGRWIAYISDFSGRNEVYVDRWPEGGARSAISVAGGDGPVWSRDGGFASTISVPHT